MSAVELHCAVTGPDDGAPLLLLGSLGSDLSIWEPQLPALATRRTVRVDLRGHGGSPAPAGPYSIAELGGDVLALMDRLGIARASLGGLSLGGMTATWLAAQAPERVERLVLICTSARVEVPEVYASRAETVLAEGTASIADAAVAGWLTPAFAAARPGLVARLRAIVAATPSEGYAGCCGALAALDLRADLAAVAAPTLVVSATQDLALPPSHGRALAAAIAGAEFVEIDGAHLPTLESPDRVNELIAGQVP